jgi:PKD repeat protein
LASVTIIAFCVLIVSGLYYYNTLTNKSTIPIANFSINVTSGFSPLSVQFTDLSENATSYNWDFGDGFNSTQQNPTHTYSAVGNYTVNLTASNVNGTDSYLAAITILGQTLFSLQTSAVM